MIDEAQIKNIGREIYPDFDSFSDLKKQAVSAAIAEILAPQSNNSSKQQGAQNNPLHQPKIDKEDKIEQGGDPDQSTDSESENKSEQSKNNSSQSSQKTDSNNQGDNKSKEDVVSQLGNVSAKAIEDAIKAKEESGFDKENNEDPKVKSSDLVRDAQRVNKQEKTERQKKDAELKANKDEMTKWANDWKTQFKASVKRFFAEEDDDRENDISRPNTRKDVGDDSQVIMGRKKVERSGIPTVNLYFDQANSSTQHQEDVGNFFLTTFAPYEKKKMLKVNLYYFAETVHKEDRHQYMNRPYAAWPDGDAGNYVDGDEIIDHIRLTGANNVLILTDHSFDDTVSKKITIDGAVWIFQYQGNNSPKFIRSVRGRMQNKTWTITD